MSWYSDMGQPVKVSPTSSNSTKTIEELLEDAIQKQQRILDGGEVLGQTNKPIRNWFRKGQFKPAVSNIAFWDDKVYRVKSGDEKKVLKKFKAGYEAGEFKDILKKISKRRDEKAAALAAARKKRK
jgi:hypothetical protein